MFLFWISGVRTAGRVKPQPFDQKSDAPPTELSLELEDRIWTVIDDRTPVFDRMSGDFRTIIMLQMPFSY